MADEYPWVSPYAYCTGDPINFVDPTGMFFTRNTGKHNGDRVLCIYANPISLPDKNLVMEQGLAHDYKNNIPILMVDDVKDCIEGLKTILASNPNYDIIVFNSHGSPGSFNVGRDKMTSNSDFSQFKEILIGKTVFINACSVGKNQIGAQITEKMGSEMIATVITSTHDLYGGYDYDGSYSLNFTPDAPPAPFSNSKNSPIFARTINNQFRLYQYGPSTHIIYDLTISRQSGVSFNFVSKQIDIYLHK